MDEQQLINAIKRLAKASEKAYDTRSQDQIARINQERANIETAICRLADELDEDDIFTC